MTCLPTTVLTLLLIYLVSTEGALSPPLNLSVDLLDFQTSVRWLPGPGNPIGTRYFVEFTDIQHFSKLVWNRSADCTHITSTQCNLILDQLFTDYFVRVMAEWKGERSNWTTLKRTFQLYKDTQLSPPSMRVSSGWHSIQVHLSHRIQSVKDVPLSFSLDLFQMTPDNRAQFIAKQSTQTFITHFFHLPLGHLYCINASAFHTQMSPHQYLNATKCIQVEHGGSAHIGLGVSVGILLLLIIPIGIVLIAKSCEMRSHFRTDSIPKTLIIEEGPVRVLQPIPDKLHVVQLLVADCLHAIQPAHEVEENAKHDYERLQFARGAMGHRSEDARVLQKLDEVGEILPHQPDLYSLAVNMESNEDLTQEEHLIPGCVLQAAPLLLPVFTSRQPRTISDRAHQKTQNDNLLLSLPDLNADESSKVEMQLQSSCNCLKTLDSSEEETDSLYSDVSLGRAYEPRPDPCWASIKGQFI